MKHSLKDILEIIDLYDPNKQMNEHTGFTRTAMWADPDYDLVYVFLSNRIHPDANNRKLIKQNIRTRIQDIIYESIFIKDINNQ